MVHVEWLVSELYKDVHLTDDVEAPRMAVAEDMDDGDARNQQSDEEHDNADQYESIDFLSMINELKKPDDVVKWAPSKNAFFAKYTNADTTRQSFFTVKYKARKGSLEQHFREVQLQKDRAMTFATTGVVETE